MHLHLFSFALIVLLLPAPARAEIKTIETDSVYVMGDNDSKVEARRIATQEAKRKALELAGTYVASLTQVREYRLTKDEVSAYTAGIIETEIVADEARGSASRPELYLKVRCRIDTDVLVREIDRYRANQELTSQLEATRREREALQRERDELQKQLASEQDKARAESARMKLAAVLSREESLDDTSAAWARLSPQTDLYGSAESNREVRPTDLEKSAADLESAVQVDPANQQARILLASVYERRSDGSAALRHLQAALERDPANPLLHMRMGIVLRGQGRYDEALREFRLIEQKRPNQPHMLYQTGLTHKMKGNCQRAVNYFRRFMMFTRRADRPEILDLRPRVVQALKDCGAEPRQPQARREGGAPLRPGMRP